MRDKIVLEVTFEHDIEHLLESFIYNAIEVITTRHKWSQEDEVLIAALQDQLVDLIGCTEIKVITSENNQ